MADSVGFYALLLLSSLLGLLSPQASRYCRCCWILVVVGGGRVLLVSLASA